MQGNFLQTVARRRARISTPRGSANVMDMAFSKMTDRMQRIELERRDRYGRFGGR